uniref:HTH_7 domain-containing protein n=1 Tax=Heterorhabditis bacteriophora TaxID=37862 RepID=A0A1I7WIT2_HETBA
MGRASTSGLYERGQIKALSSTGYTVKQIADVVKRSGKVIMNFLRHQNMVQRRVVDDLAS